MTSLPGEIASFNVETDSRPANRSRGSIGRLVLTVLAMVWLLVIAIGVAGWIALDRVEQSTARGGEQAALSRATLALDTALGSTYAAAMEAVTTPDAETFGRYVASRQRLDELISQMRSTRDGARVEQLIQNDGPTRVQTLAATLDRAVDDARAGRGGEARELLTGARGDFGLVSQGLQADADIAARAATSSLTTSRDVSSSWRLLLAVFGAIGAILGAAAVIAVTRRIAPPSLNLARQLEDVAAGDLVLQPIPDAPGELFNLADAFRRMRLNLRAVIAQMSDALRSITASAEDFKATSQRYATGSGHQAAAVGEIARTMGQLSRSAEQIAAGAVRATSIADEGRMAVDAAVAGMTDVQAKVEAAAESSVVLNSRSERVGVIADIIDEVANKTHILALNAAIEAAAAGEYGRRFGVVAGQIRSLAEETQRATAQVKAIVAEIRESTASLAAVSADANAVAARGADLSERAHSSIRDVVTTVRVIADATQQQSAATAEMVETMSQIADVSQESAAGSQQAAASATRLATTAADLQALVSRFRLERGSQPS